MNPLHFAASSLMYKFGLEPDPWQVEVLDAGHPRLLLNCCRQAGKSTAVALLGLMQGLLQPGSLVLLLSRSHRQSMELYRIVTGFLDRLRVHPPIRQSMQELELKNGSRIITLPCKEETIRGYSGVDLLIIDEAARVPDDLYRAARPMLAVSQGRMVCLSTPYGKQGFFWDAWAHGCDDWQRIEIRAEKIPRITPAFLESERRALGESWFRQEYCCSFEALEGLVYPDLGKCVVPAQASHSPRSEYRTEKVCCQETRARTSCGFSELMEGGQGSSNANVPRLPEPRCKGPRNRGR
jgi:hypothetical protein